MSVYDVGTLGERFDIVLFLGVLYHLRHPLLALDLIHEHVAKDLLVFQSMLRGSREVANVDANYRFWTTDLFDRPDYPKMHFVEHEYASDRTNWWIPNRACHGGHAAQRRLRRSPGIRRTKSISAASVGRPYVAGAVYPAREPRR